MCISDFSNCELVALASSLAIAISKQVSNEELIILSVFFTTLADNLALLSLENQNKKTHPNYRVGFCFFRNQEILVKNSFFPSSVLNRNA